MVIFIGFLNRGFVFQVERNCLDGSVLGLISLKQLSLCSPCSLGGTLYRLDQSTADMIVRRIQILKKSKHTF